MSQGFLLRLLYFLVFCCTASWLPVLADFCRHRGLDHFQTSLVLSVTPLAMFIAQPLCGMLADRFGYRRVLLTASAFGTVSYLAYLQTGGFSWVMGVTVMMSLFYNTIQPVLDSLSLQLAKENSGYSYGSLRIAGAAGWSVTGIITGQTIDRLSLDMIFAISAASMGLVFLSAVFLKLSGTNDQKSSNNTLKGAGKLLRDRKLLFFLLCVVLVSVGSTTIWNFYSLYLKENGASASLVGFGLSFQGLCELPFFWFSARIIARVGLKPALVLTVLVTALRLFLYGIVRIPELAIGIELLQGISWSLFWVVCVEYVNRMVSPERMATGQSLLYAAYYGVGAIAGNFWTGYLSERSLPLTTIFLMNAAGTTVVALVIWWWVWNPSKPLNGSALG